MRKNILTIRKMPFIILLIRIVNKFTIGSLKIELPLPSYKD